MKLSLTVFGVGFAHKMQTKITQMYSLNFPMGKENSTFGDKLKHKYEKVLTF